MWQPDLVSVLIGVVLGVSLAGVAVWAWPRVVRLRTQSVNRVRETHSWVRAGVEKRFQMETATYVSRFHLGGEWVTLADVFVAPRLLCDPPAPEMLLERYWPAQDLIYLWPELAGRVVIPPVPTMSVRQLLLQGRRVLFPSPAGSGKTTLLAYCAYLCAQAEEDTPEAFLLPVLPIFVHLAELDLDRPRSGAAESDPDPVLPLIAALQRRSGPLTASGIAGLVRKKLAAGQVLLLLDGGDDIPPAQFPVSWLADLLSRFPKIRVFAAFSPAGYGPLLDLGFTLSGVLPWSQGEATLFGRRWAETGKGSPNTLDQYWRPGRTALETTLKYWWSAGALPGQEAVDRPDQAVTEEIMERLLFDAGSQDKQLDSGLLPSLWATMAYYLLVREKSCVHKADLEMLVERHFSAVAEAEGHPRQPARFAQTVWERMEKSPLFVVWGGERAAFRSPLLRDYLVAQHLAGEGGLAMIQAHDEDSQWAAVVRFYISRWGEQQLAEKLLDPRSSDPLRENLFQVVDWLPQTDTPGEWRRQTLIQLGQLIVQSGVPQALRQRAVAAISLTSEPGVPALVHQLMQRPEPELRQAAAMAAVNLERKIALDTLEKLAIDGDRSVREIAIYCLGWLADPAAEQPLLLALIGRDPAVSEAAAICLAGRGEEGGQILREAAEDEAVHVRRAAILGLANIEADWVEGILKEKALHDAEWLVKSAAALALEESAGRHRPERWLPLQVEQLAWLAEWAARREQSLPAGTKAVPLLCDLLAREKRPELRALAARSLGLVQLSPEQVAAVQHRLRDAWGDQRTSVRDAAFFSWVRLVRAYGVAGVPERPAGKNKPAAKGIE